MFVATVAKISFSRTVYDFVFKRLPKSAKNCVWIIVILKSKFDFACRLGPGNVNYDNPTNMVHSLFVNRSQYSSSGL